MSPVDHVARLLVVDDDANLLELLKDTLVSIGYKVDGASDGVKAMERLKHGEYDLMITDIKMPGMDGISLLKKARRYYPRLPVLFITGLDSPEIIGQASPDGLLAKPFRISHIEELIENALRGQAETAEQPLRRVMIVDDDDTFRKSLSDMLSAHDYITLAVSSAEEALRELQYDDIDAVVSDIKMPGMDGIALTKEVKQRHPDLPVVLITGFLSASEAGLQADGFLRKPFRVESIIRLLESVIPQATIAQK